MIHKLFAGQKGKWKKGLSLLLCLALLGSSLITTSVVAADTDTDSVVVTSETAETVSEETTAETATVSDGETAAEEQLTTETAEPEAEAETESTAEEPAAETEDSAEGSTESTEEATDSSGNTEDSLSDAEIGTSTEEATETPTELTADETTVSTGEEVTDAAVKASGVSEAESETVGTGSEIVSSTSSLKSSVSAVAAAYEEVSLTATSGETIEVGVNVSTTLTGSSGSNHSWSSNNTSVATVTGNENTATVTGISPGVVVITHTYKEGRTNKSETYEVLVPGDVKVYVYVASYYRENGTTIYFSDEMLDLLGIDSSTIDNNDYFPAGEITLDASYFVGKGSTANKESTALINSVDGDDSDWAKVLAALGELDTTTLVAYDESEQYANEDYSLNRGNNVGEYINYANVEADSTWGSQKTALFHWHYFDYSNNWNYCYNCGATDCTHYGFADQTVQYHLDLAFQAVKITYIAGNNGISSGSYQDRTSFGSGSFIKGVTLTNDYEPTSVGAPEGYEFVGFYKDADFTEEFTYGDPITQDTTVYLKWEKIKRDVTVTKVWEDNSNAYNTRPGSISVTLKADGDIVNTSQSLSTAEGENSVSYTYEDLYLYNYGSNGVATDKIKYTVEETGQGDDYTATYSEAVTDDDGNITLTITNTLKKVSITVTKTLSGNMADYGKAFGFEIKAGDEVVSSFDLTNGKTSSAVEVPYGSVVTITEKNKEGYDMTVTTGVSGGSVTNGTKLYDTSTYSFTATGATNFAIVINNDKTVTPDTGLNLDSLPYILILAGVAVIGGVVLLRRRRKLL